MRIRTLFRDKRSRKLVLVSHCLLNQNSRALGLARRPGVLAEIVGMILRNNVGVIQMPCPELAYAGLLRQPRTKEQYDNAHYRENCRKLATVIAGEIQDYKENGVQLKLVIGICKSPTCGVSKPGVFMEELGEAMKRKGISVPFCEATYERSDERLSEIEQSIRD